MPSRQICRTLAIIAVASVTPAVWLGAQEAQKPSLPTEFEAASIRPSTSTETFTLIRQNTGGRFIADNITVANLIQQAYQVFRFQVVDGPSWIDRDRFDIQAVAPGTGFAQQGGLLRQLLADRFALRVRREMREQDVYALVIARSDGRLGPNLRPFTGECTPPPGEPPRCFMRNGPNFTDATGLPISVIVSQATGNVGRIVIDKTGLTGRFDFKYEWTTDLSTRDADGRVPFVTALREQLGLALETRRAPVEAIVIERVDRPTPN